MFDRYKKITNDVVNLVSGVSKESQKTLNVLAPLKLRENLVALAAYCSSKDLVIGCLGQICVRLPSKKCLMVKENASFSRLSSSDFRICSTESRMSLSEDILLKVMQFNEIDAVLFCQPTACLSIAVDGDEFKKQSILFEFSPRILFFENRNEFLNSELDFADINEAVVMIRGVGLLSYATSIEEAIDMAEYTERFCQIMLNVSKK